MSKPNCSEPRPHVRIGSRRISIPRSKAARMAIGIALVMGGLLGFLPALGFWMIPLGIIVLAHDFPLARRLVRAGRRWFVRAVRTWRGARR
jgi:hypothetical protein